MALITLLVFFFTGTLALFKKDKFSLKDGKIHLSEIDELIKINNYYTKVDELKRRDRSK